jgi:hypothetical protein
MTQWCLVHAVLFTCIQRCWVQVKYIADPSMHSMPAVAEHPNGKALCYQSLDNQIVTYNTTGRFRQNRKKTFKGHLTSGHACQARFHRSLSRPFVFLPVICISNIAVNSSLLHMQQNHARDNRNGQCGSLLVANSCIWYCMQCPFGYFELFWFVGTESTCSSIACASKRQESMHLNDSNVHTGRLLSRWALPDEWGRRREALLLELVTAESYREDHSCP